MHVSTAIKTDAARVLTARIIDAEEIIDLNLVVQVRWDGVEAGVGAVRLALPVRPLALARRGALWEGGFKSANTLDVGAHFGL